MVNYELKCKGRRKFFFPLLLSPGLHLPFRGSLYLEGFSIRTEDRISARKVLADMPVSLYIRTVDLLTMRKTLAIFLLLLVLSLSLVHGLTNRRTYLNVTGDIILGGLFPIHGKGNGAGENCGKIQIEDGIQPLEAMLYTLGQINENPNILPGIRLGAVIFDTCDSPTYALEQALYFIKGFIAHTNEYHRKEFRCSDHSVPRFLSGSFDRVVAVLGAQSSSVTIQVASVLALFLVPQISYMATSPFLSSKERFPHFFRTVPSDVNQARAMLEILRRFEWSYASVVYSDSEYGDHGYEILTSLASEYSICFSAPHRISTDRFMSEEYDNVVRTIAEETDVRVVVLFAEKSTTLRVLEAARRVGVESRFVWVGSDSWPATNYPEDRQDGRAAVLEGALAIQPLYRSLSGFDEYFTGLTLRHEDVNPWFREFWREYHGCGKTTIDGQVIDCTDPGLKIDSSTGYKQRKFLHFVRDAVYAMAYALHDLQMEKCKGDLKGGMCEEMRHIDGELLSRYLAKVSFKDEVGNKFGFVNAVDGPPRYSIMNYQRNENGSYHWVVVGNYTQNDNGRAVLWVDRAAMRFPGGRKQVPTSSCDGACGPYHVMVRAKRDPCCWRCQSCGLYRYKFDEQRCEECEWGSRPSADGGGCELIPEEYVDYTSTWAIGAMTVAVCGMALTTFVCSVFWIYRQTPIIKASGRELSFLLLLGTFVSFSMTFAIVAKPTGGSCALTRFGIGFCYALCYAALVTKTNRIHRIFNDPARSPRKRRYTSPTSQLFITAILTLFQVIVDVSWLLNVPPEVIHAYPTRESNLRVCRGSDDGSYVLGLIYPFLLTAACTFYAVKTRKCPEGFNETRCIAFANYATMILWLAFVPLYLASTSNNVRVVTLALSLSFNGLVHLVCLFFPKLYVVLIKPEKNTRELVMARHGGGGGGGCGTPSYPTTPAATTANTSEILMREAADSSLFERIDQREVFLLPFFRSSPSP